MAATLDPCQESAFPERFNGRAAHLRRGAAGIQGASRNGGYMSVTKVTA